MGGSRRAARARARAARARALLAAVTALACGGLVACGGAPGPAAGGVCAQAGQVDRLVVTRTDPFPGSGAHFTFPAKVVVSDPGQARSVARAACALPYMHSGAYACQEGRFRGWYTLGFATNGTRLPAVRIESTCEDVRGLRGVRLAAFAPGFWRVLGTAMGLAHPGRQDFLPGQPPPQ